MNVKKMTTLSVSVALAMVLSFLETLIPTLVAVPGVKIGLANIVAVFLLYAYGWREAAAVSFTRVCLSALLFGSAVSLIYSASGAALSLVGMILAKKLPLFSAPSVSVLGGVLHNAGQIICAALIMENAAIALYFPPLVISGTISGIAVGIAAAILLKKLLSIVR
ncbi:MAG: Gx transporter family protein [Ruminococcaceae bacterium]|nr:Gx transporter family protein [Oscillospiraceae bacterium]